MKLTLKQMGAFLAATITTIICILGFPPLIQKIGAISSLSVEKNLVTDQIENAPFLKTLHSSLKLPAHQPVDIFAGVTAKSPEGEDLIPMLKEDYRKSLYDRKSVFIYHIDADGSATLSPFISTSTEGKWTVVFAVDYNNAISTMKVNYSIEDPYMRTESEENTVPDRIF